MATSNRRVGYKFNSSIHRSFLENKAGHKSLQFPRRSADSSSLNVIFFKVQYTAVLQNTYGTFRFAATRTMNRARRSRTRIDIRVHLRHTTADHIDAPQLALNTLHVDVDVCGERTLQTVQYEFTTNHVGSLPRCSHGKKIGIVFEKSGAKSPCLFTKISSKHKISRVLSVSRAPYIGQGVMSLYLGTGSNIVCCSLVVSERELQENLLHSWLCNDVVLDSKFLAFLFE
eukprot:SAG31_NODE_1684_length_7534_cov_6.461870_1_plen_229_part_00